MLNTFYTNPFPVLEVNDQYSLREQDIKDSSDFFQYYSDPKVGQHILANKPTNITEASTEIIYCRNLFEQKKGIYWSIVDKSNNKMIGAIGIYMNNYHSRGEICYDLAASHWNKGIMSKALKVVIDYCFSNMGLARLEATTLAENTASIMILNKLGFKHEGTLKKYRYFQEKFYDIEMYSLISPIFSVATETTKQSVLA